MQVLEVISSALDDLIANEDIIETTVRQNTASYIASYLYDNHMLKEKGPFKMPKEITIKMKPKRKYPREPFAQYKEHAAWKVLDQAIEDLVENQDIVETTVRKFIVGYLIKQLVKNDLLKASKIGEIDN